MESDDGSKIKRVESKAGDVFTTIMIMHDDCTCSGRPGWPVDLRSVDCHHGHEVNQVNCYN